MKKFFAAILLTVLLSGNVYAEELSEAIAAPAEINHPDSIYFAHPDFFNMNSTADRIILPHYPTFQQTTEYSCGAAAVLTVLKFFGRNDFDETTLIKLMKTKPHVGTNVGNMVTFFRNIGRKVQSSSDMPTFDDDFAFQKFVMKNLSLGRPILVENVEYGGHWRVIIGIDTMGTENLYDDVLIFADPYDTSDHLKDGYAIQSLDGFFSEWFDHNLLPKRERNQPRVIAVPK